jgi:hypothetical protein
VAWTASGNTPAVWGGGLFLSRSLTSVRAPRYRKWKRINLSRINIGALAAIIITEFLKIIVPVKLTGINAMERQLCKKHISQRAMNLQRDIKTKIYIFNVVRSNSSTEKGKAIQIQTWTISEISRTLRLADLMKISCQL